MRERTARQSYGEEGRRKKKKKERRTGKKKKEHPSPSAPLHPPQQNNKQKPQIKYCIRSKGSLMFATLVLMGDFSLPGVCLKYSAGRRKWSERLLGCVDTGGEGSSKGRCPT